MTEEHGYLRSLLLGRGSEILKEIIDSFRVIAGIICARSRAIDKGWIYIVALTAERNAFHIGAHTVVHTVFGELIHKFGIALR